VAEANTGVMGGAFEWLSGLLFPDRPREARPAALARAAESVQPGANGLTAHLGPAVLDMSDPTLRAGGFAFPVPLALDAPSPGDLGRAALENFAFAIRDALAATAHVENAEPAVALGGGLSRSRLLARVLSAVTGEPMLVGTGDDSLAGAISSAAAGKEGGSLSELSRRRRQRLRAVRPHDLDTSVYRDLYEGWKERSRALEQVAL
jgi:sugar (pentulose or hexulose) kinase